MTQDLFDREKLNIILAQNSVTWVTLQNFIQSECQRNRIEAVKEFAERVRPTKTQNPYNDDDLDLEAGWDDCAENINSKIATELSKPQTKEGGE